MKNIIKKLLREELLERQDEKNVNEINDIFNKFVMALKSGLYHKEIHANGYDPYIFIVIDIPKKDVKFKTQSDYIGLTLSNLPHNTMQGKMKGGYSINRDNNVPYINIWEAGFKLNDIGSILNVDEVIKINEVSIKHELTHYIDEVMKGRPLDSVTKITDKTKKNQKQSGSFLDKRAEFFKQYGVTPSENNALILAFLSSVERIPDTFDEFINDFVSFGERANDKTYKDLLKNPDERKRKSLINRLYQFYDKMKNKD